MSMAGRISACTHSCLWWEMHLFVNGMPLMSNEFVWVTRPVWALVWALVFGLALDTHLRHAFGKEEDSRHVFGEGGVAATTVGPSFVTDNMLTFVSCHHPVAMSRAWPAWPGAAGN